jgi:hypothetical protein
MGNVTYVLFFCCLCAQVTANKKELGVAFKKDAKTIADALEALPEDEADCLRKTLESGNFYITSLPLLL